MGGRRGKHVDRSSFPVEQGSIASIKDSFGFIHCANRVDGLFFHFSEVRSCHPADLQVNDEVEFRVGQSGKDDKLAAYDLVKLDPGTVVWEVEDEPGVRFQGIVERPIRSERGSSQMSEGTIRVLLEANEEVEGDNKEKKGMERVAASANGPLIRFLAKDCNTNDSEGSLLLTDSSISFSSRSASGTGTRLCRNDLVEFSVVTTLRSKTKYAKGITVLQSERERQRLEKEEELLSKGTIEQGVVTSLKNDYGFLRSNKRHEEVYFHYSNVELSNGGTSGEDEEDEDEHVLKEGQDMEFVVVTEPSEGKSRKSRCSARKARFLPKGSVLFRTTLAEGVLGKVVHCATPNVRTHGKIALKDPINDVDDTGQNVTVQEVALRFADSPGGLYPLNKDGSEHGVWLREGDILLFDVVKETVDGAYRAYPTSHSAAPNSSKEKERTSRAKSIRLVTTTLVGRAEGVVHAIKDGYGFIQVAEREVDTYFRISELLPSSMQSDLLHGLGLSSKSPIGLEVGAEVQFDLWVQEGVKQNSKSRLGSRQDKENLKAQRLLLLPPGSVMQTKIVAKGVEGVVKKVDPKQPSAGRIELTQELEPMKLTERHPLVASLVRSLLETHSSGDSAWCEEEIVFPYAQSSREEDIIKNIVAEIGKDKIQCSHLPETGDKRHPGRFRVAKVMETEEVTTKNEVGEGGTAEAVTTAHLVDGSESASEGKQRKSRKKKAVHHKSIKVVRYDKHSLSKETTSEGGPLAMGDKILADIHQSRRTGVFSLANIRIVERAPREANESGVGLVVEVVVARQFGFIVVWDDDLLQRDRLFFHFKNVNRGAEKNKGKDRTAPLRKGDEVKFEISVAKNRKKTAINVVVLPKGTIEVPRKPHEHACRGYVLIEASDNTVSDSRLASSLSPKRGGRWDGVALQPKESHHVSTPAKDEGWLMLIEDATDMFVSQATDKAKGLGALLMHLPFSKNALALHGPGATSVLDASQGPKRGDLVSFVKTKNRFGVCDIRIVERGHATVARGRLVQIELAPEKETQGSAVFNAATDGQELQYEIGLNEVLRCDPSILKEEDRVEGILYKGKIHGVCRSSDRILEAKLSSLRKERPKLNLMVRKDLGGKIMAQSMMAKVRQSCFLLTKEGHSILIACFAL